MKRLLLAVLMGLALLRRGEAAQTSFVNPAGATFRYVNNGTTVNPQIDALNFINNGIFLGQTLRPFETFDTLNFTNSGTMIGEVGFRFDSTPATGGPRQWAANFVNRNPGVVQAADVTFLLGTVFFLNAPCEIAPVVPSWLLISATNIINGAGTRSGGAALIVGANGDMELEGKNVDVSRSALEVNPVWLEPLGSFNLTPPTVTNFFPDVAITDEYWAQASFNRQHPLPQSTLWSQDTNSGDFVAQAPAVLSPNAGPSRPVPAPPIILTNPAADSYINVPPRGTVTIPILDSQSNSFSLVLRSNISKGAVFVGVPFGADPPTFEFQPSTEDNNNFDTVGVLLNFQVQNAVSGLPEIASVYIQDTLASDTAIRGVAANSIGCPPGTTSRPGNYILQRLNGLIDGGPLLHNGSPTYDPNFFLDSGNGAANPDIIGVDLVTNQFRNLTAGDYSAYGAFLDNVVSEPALVIGADATNRPGRIKIRADSLNLDQARIRGEGIVDIQAQELISSSNAVIDCQVLNFNLGSRNGNLTIQNLSKDSVERFTGTIRAWSAVWNNTVRVIITNNFVFTNEVVGGVTNPVVLQAPLTNFLTVGYHAFMIDATAMGTFLPVTVNDFAAHSTSVVVNDAMTVAQSFLIDGRNLTLNTNLTFSGVLAGWTAANAPTLQNFTNNGTLFLANEAHFGDDRTPRYSNFFNRGSISAGSIQLNSAFFENTGTLLAQGSTLFNGITPVTTPGPLVMQGDSGKLENGTSTSGDVQFTAGTLKFNNYQLAADGALNFDVTGALFDAGPGSGNVLSVRDGFNLAVKPQTGDLLGTTIQSSAPNFPALITHAWAGENRGPTPAGYSNNVAVGRLILTAPTNSPVFHFTGTGANNALYVDLLDLSGLGADYLDQIQIDDNLVIYYAAAKLGFTPPPDANSVPIEPEEYLNGQFNGHLRWATNFAGPNSSTPAIIVVNGVPTSVMVNAALRNSLFIDSNGDGIPNGDDPFPFPPVAVVANVAFVPTVGTYKGLFYESNGVEFLKSGAFAATTTARGAYSGTLQMALNRYSFSGQFDTNGLSTKVIKRSGTNSPLTLQLQAGQSQITGTVGGGSWIAGLLADRSVFNARTNPAPFAGKYTIVFPGTGDPGNKVDPQSDGYGAVTVSSTGGILLNGSLADGAVLSQSATASPDAEWPFYVPLYSGKGQILGWLNFVSTDQADLGGAVSWIRLPTPGAKYYGGGFDFETQATGSAYNPLAKPIVGFSSGALELTGGNLAAGITNLLTVNTNNRVTNLSTNRLALTLLTAQGWFKGSVINPTTGKSITLNGAVLQKQNAGFGFFLGTNQSGHVLLRP